MKRAISMVLVLILALWTAAPVFAVEGDITADDDGVKAYALDFMRGSQENPDITIRNFHHLTDGSGQPTGYYVTFNNGTEPAGYVILSMLHGENPVVEFAFEGEGRLGGDSANLGVTEEGGVDSFDMIFTGAGQLYVPLGDGEYYSLYDYEVTADAKLYLPQARGGYVDIEAGLKSWTNAQIDNNTQFKISNFGMGADYFLMTDFSDSKKNCSPTCATNILYYWGFKRNCKAVQEYAPGSTKRESGEAIYRKVLRGLGTTEEGTNSELIELGYTTFFEDFPSASGEDRKWNVRDLEYGTSFADYKSALRDNLPLHMSVYASREDLRTGHAVMVMGYANSKKGENYFSVIDGLHGTGYYINYKYYPYFVAKKIWVNENYK